MHPTIDDETLTRHIDLELSRIILKSRIEELRASDELADIAYKRLKKHLEEVHEACELVENAARLVARA